MFRRLFHVLRLSAAVALPLAGVLVPLGMSYAAAAPMTMATHAHAPGRDDAGGHRHTDVCCDLCLIACHAAAPPGRVAVWRLPAPLAAESRVAGAIAVALPSWPHRFPLAIGPPSLRA